MKNLLFLIFFLGTISFLHTQQDARLAGVVVELNSKFNTGRINYLSTAQVKSIGANPQFSNTEGKFTLIFADKPTGNTVRIYASKNGFEIVNAEELKNAAILGRSTPLKVVMCKDGQLYENQIAYYKVAEDAAKASFDRRMAILEKEGRDKDRLLEELRIDFEQEITSIGQAKNLLVKQLETAERQAKTLANKWVTVNLDDQSDVYQAAFRAFMNKDIDRALSILDSIGLEERLAANAVEKEKEGNLIDTLKTSIAKREAQMQQDINQCVFKAELHILNNEFDKAEEMYELALKYGDDPELIHDFAIFLYKQKKISKAEELFDKELQFFIELAKEDSLQYRSNIARIHINLGNIYVVLRKYDQAESLFLESLKVFQQLVIKERVEFKSDVARIQMNLGSLYYNLTDYSKSLSGYLEALKIYNQLTEENSKKYESDLARVQMNIAALYYSLNMLSKSKIFFLKSVEIRKRLANEIPGLYESDLAITYMNLGNLYSRLGDTLNAKNVFIESIETYKRLANKNPQRYEPDLAKAQMNFGSFYADLKDYENAKIIDLQSLKIYNQLTKEFPKLYEPEMANLQMNLGNLYKDIKKYDKAKIAYEESFKIRTRLVEENPQQYNISLCYTLINIGIFKQSLLEQSMDIQFQKEGKETVNQLNVILNQYDSTNPTIKMLQDYVDELKVYFDEITEEDLIVLDTIAKIIIPLEESHENENDPTIKVFKQEEITALLEKLIRDYPQNKKLLIRTSNAYDELARNYLFTRQFKSAEIAALRRLELDQNEETINIHLDMSRLYQRKTRKSKKLYRKIKDLSTNNERYKTSFLADLTSLEKEGITCEGASEVRKLLEE